MTIPSGQMIRIMMATPGSQSGPGADKLWASPQGWVKCQTDANGNIILVDRDDPRLTEFKGGYLANSDSTKNIGEVVPETVVINGETVEIDKVPIPSIWQNMRITMEKVL